MHFTEDASAIERALIDRASQARSPINGSIELTPICNMNCDMCYVRLSPAEVARQGRLRTVDEWLEIARQMRDAGTLFLLLTGGEPLTYPDFRRLYRELMKLGMLLTINTNGTLIDEDWADFFAENKPRRINITLYGSDEETYKNLCHYPGGFEKTVNAIRLLRERDVPVRVNLSVTRENAPHLSRMIELCKELDAAVLVDTYMTPVTRERERPFDQQSRLHPIAAAQARIFSFSRTMAPKDFVRFVMESLVAARNLPPKEDPNRMSCLAGSCSYTINWQGEMRPCVILSNPAADVFEFGFDAAWRHIRAELDKVILSSRCAKCSLRLLCNTCAAAALSETGSLDGTPEYLCVYAREMLRLLVLQARRFAQQKHADGDRLPTDDEE